MTTGFRQSAWVIAVTDAGYAFEQNVERIHKGIAEFGLLIGLDIYKNLACE